MRICAVPSPTYAESERAAFVASIFRELGYEPEIDDISNVYARRGNKNGKVVLVLAHIEPSSRQARRSMSGVTTSSSTDRASATTPASPGMPTVLQILDEFKVDTMSISSLSPPLVRRGLATCVARAGRSSATGIRSAR